MWRNLFHHGNKLKKLNLRESQSCVEKSWDQQI